MDNTPQARLIHMPELMNHTEKIKSVLCHRLHTAYHVINALPSDFLERLDFLRPNIPLDLSRPTCPRRFLSEWEGNPGDPERHHENGWVTLGINQAVQSWNLDVDLETMPWFRFLEYPPGHVGMPPHVDGCNKHPHTDMQSVATMLIYLSDSCTEIDGETIGSKGDDDEGDGSGCQSSFKSGTTLYITRKLTKKEKREKKEKRKQGGESKSQQQVLESFPCKRNTAIIFPHQWLHAGNPVGENHKIALRCELLFSSKKDKGRGDQTSDL